MIGFLLFCLLEVGLFVAGIGLILRGERCKLRHHECTCGYIIKHLPPHARLCPECGKELSKNPVRRWKRGNKIVNAGVLLVFLAILAPLIG